MFPFYFSGINSSMLSPNPGDSINLSWNMWNAKNAANSIMFMTPSFNTAFYDFPDVMTFGNSLLDPRLAIQQTLNSFNNGGWMNGMNGGSWFNNMFKSPWSNSDSSNSGKTDKEKAENKLMQKQYDKLKAVLKSYKENSTTLTDEQEAKLETALNKGGKIEEKLDALKSVYKELDSKELRKALLALDENKIALDRMGYNFDDTSFSYKNEDDQVVKNAITKIEAEVAEGKYDTLQTYIPNAESNDGILKLISYWNDEHKGDTERSIIRFIASNFPDDSAKQKNAKETVTAMTTALVNKAKEVCGRIENCANLDNAQEALMEQLNETNKDFKAETLKTLADKFEDVYARIRMAEAEELSAKIKKDYEFLNDISDSDTDFVNTNLIVEDVKADLKKEEIEIKEEELDKIKDGKGTEDNNTTAMQETVKNLVASGDLRETNCKKPMVYYSESKKTHYLIRDGKLLALDGVTIVYGNGNCQKSDGTVVAISSIKGTEVNAESLKSVNKNNAGKNKTSDSPKEAGKVLRQKLYGDTSEEEYKVVEQKLKEYSNYTKAEDIVTFIEAYNEEENGWYQWNNHICAQISTEHGDYFKPKREKYLKVIASQILKVMDACGYSEDDDDYVAMKYYAENAGTEGNEWDKHNNWPTWLTWSSARTNAATKMDEIIDDVIEKYREKHPAE